MKLRCLFIVMVVLAFIPLVSGEITDGLVAYYSFDVDGRDDSGNGWNGTIQTYAHINASSVKLGDNGISDYEGNWIGNWMVIEGTASAPEWNFMYTMTTCGWYRYNGIPAHDWCWWGITKRGTTIPNENDLGFAQAYVNNYGGTNGFWAYYGLSSGTINVENIAMYSAKNEYEFLCAIKNTTGLYFYQNNTLGYTNPSATGYIQNSPRDARLNSAPYSETYMTYGPWVGDTDEVGIWNRSLTESEMDFLYNNGNGRNPVPQLIFNVTITPLTAYPNDTLTCHVTNPNPTNMTTTWFTRPASNYSFVQNTSFDASAYNVDEFITSLGNGSFPQPHQVGSQYKCEGAVPNGALQSDILTIQQFPCIIPQYTVLQQTQTNYTDLTGGWVGLGNLFDNDWGTYGYYSCGGCSLSAQVQIEYAKPTYSVNATWHIKDSRGEVNVTIWQECWDAYPDRIILAAWSQDGAPYATNWFCYNGTVWLYERTAVNGGNAFIYEEEINWHYNFPPNVTISYSLPNLAVSPVPNFYLNTTFLYSNTTSNSCQLNDNASWLSCTNVSHGWCSSSSASTCTVTGHHEGNVTFNVTCPQGITSQNYNIYIDADSNPTITTNSSSAYSTTPGLPFYFVINATQWVEVPTCGLHQIDPVLACSVGSMASQGAGRYLGLVTCIGTNFTQTNMSYYVQCNGTSIYQQINSSLIGLVYDPVGPAITYSQFTGNGSWFAKNITGRWDFYDINLYRINVSIDGNPIFQQSGINATNYTYILNHYVGDLTPGFHEFDIWMFDSHTKRDLQDEWTVSTPLLSDKLVFTPKRKGVPQARIEIESADENNFINPWEAQKSKDKYTFTFDTDKKVEEPSTFIVKSDLPIDIIRNPNTKWKEWAVTGEYWVDFYMEDSARTTVERIDEYTVRFVVEGKSKPKDEGKEEKDGGKMVFESVGELNSVHQHWYFNSYNVTTTYTQVIPEGTAQVASMILNYGLNLPPYIVTLKYNGTTIPYTTTDSGTAVTFNSSTFYSIAVPTTMNVSGSWNIVMPFESNNVSFTQMVVKFSMSTFDCSNDSYMKAITFYGKDEVTDLNLTFDMNVHFSLWIDNELIMSDLHLELRNQSQYDLCIYPNNTVYHMSAILEYYAPGYSQRKFYLYNTTLSSVHQDINLYLLPSTDTTEIIVYVLDAATLDPVEGAYINVLRYYPGRSGSSTYSLVERAVTDNQGRTIIKLTVVDVFYKFIIEYPSGIVKLETEVQKILTATKTFLIDLTPSSNFGVWNNVQQMTTTTTCTESTETCRFTWVSGDQTARTGTLKVYRELGYTRELLFQQSLQTSSGTIAYTVVGYQNNTVYTAESSIEGMDSHMYPGGTDSMTTEDNPMNNSSSFRLAILFPYLLLVIVLGAAFLDIGTTGVAIGALVALIGGWIFCAIPFDVRTGIPMIIMIFVVLFKLSRE